MITLHRAERADALAAALAGILATAPADPFAREVVAVPTRGVERWLSQVLGGRLGAGAAGDGICANVDFPFPGRLVDGAVARAGGLDADRDPWPPERSVWPLLCVVRDSLDEPWMEGVAGHFGAAPGEGHPGRGRRFAAVRHVADLFDRYAVHRPAMLRAWADGRDDDGDGAELPPDLRWQPALWRALRARIGVPSRAERLAHACARLRDDPSLADLPSRIALFGLTRLPDSYLDVLAALGAGRDVHLFLLHPSPSLWGAAGPHVAGPVPRAGDATAGAARNPLLSSWGRDAREMQSVVAARADREHHHPPSATDAGTLLGRLQDDVRANRTPPGAPAGPGAVDARMPLAADDRSLEVHACHGRDRQVEVVRDAILHAMADDPTLEPRDVLVMCPDIEGFAPLVHAAFAAGDDGQVDGERPLPEMRVRLADRSLRQTNPVLGVVARLVELASARVTVAEVLDLAVRDPVRRRFRLDDDDLARMERWMTDAGVRWGLDAAHRARFGLGDLEDNTWHAGLQRLLAGVAMHEQPGVLLAGVLPLDDVEGRAIDLAGRVAELVERLRDALASLEGPHPVGEWLARIAAAADALCAVAPAEAWQRDELDGLLEELGAEAATAPDAPELELPEAEALMADRLRGRPTRANFRTGHLTVCTLVPMRSVPHRMVCLMGLDDGAFPRHGAPDGDDIVAHAPRVGDRDVRGEDRQLLLDAVMAASERLVVAYSGFDARTNAALPPAVPVSELLDVVDATARVDAAGHGGDPRTAARAIVHEHPLQPFDPRNFAAGAVGRRPAPWSFDRAALAGARALEAGPEGAGPAFLDGPLPPPDLPVIGLPLLERFVGHPVATFLGERLDVSPARPEEAASESIPVELDGLGRWAVGSRLIEAGLTGVAVEDARRTERARGLLPPGGLGDAVLDQVSRLAERIVALASEFGGAGPADSLALDLALPDGRSLVGTVAGIHGDVILHPTFSRLKPKDRLASWVRLVALTAAAPERPWRAVLVGRPTSRGGAAAACAGPLGDDAATRARTARAELARLIDLLDRGLREPLPIFCATSAAYAAAARAGGDPLKAAAGEWDRRWVNGSWIDGEGADPAHRLVFGTGLALDDIAALPPAPGERGDGWDAGEPGRMGRLALRLWAGLAAHEEVVRR